MTVGRNITLTSHLNYYSSPDNKMCESENRKEDLTPVAQTHKPKIHSHKANNSCRFFPARQMTYIYKSVELSSHIVDIANINLATLLKLLSYKTKGQVRTMDVGINRQISL
jgi:hypothetical protein